MGGGRRRGERKIEQTSSDAMGEKMKGRIRERERERERPYRDFRLPNPFFDTTLKERCLCI